MKIRSVIVLFCTLSLLINACSMPGGYSVIPPTAHPNPAVAIDMYYPDNGSIYSTGELMHLVGIIKAVSDSTQISGSSFLVNGTPVAATTNTEPGNLNGSSYGTWTATDPGEYYIQAKVTLNDGSSAISEPRRICVTPFVLAGRSDLGGGRGYLGPCPLATQIPQTQTPPPGSSGDVTMTAVAVPNTFRFGDNCWSVDYPAIQPVTFIAQVNDPQDLVALVRVIFLSAGSALPRTDIYLNWVTTRPVNQKEYRGTIASMTDRLHGIDSVNWQVIAYGRDGGQLQVVDGAFTIDRVPYCGLPTPTPTVAVVEVLPQVPVFIPPRFTLTKNAFCRKGPDVAFSDISAITAGETVDILNVSEDGFWYFIDWQKFKAKCWVAKGTGNVKGDTTGLKVLIGPALPEPKLPSEPKPPSKPVVPTVACNPFIKTCP